MTIIGSWVRTLVAVIILICAGYFINLHKADIAGAVYRTEDHVRSLSKDIRSFKDAWQYFPKGMEVIRYYAIRRVRR